MDDHKAVYEALLQVYNEGRAAALATIIETQGSMPRHAGSKMLMYADGSVVGTVGGGALEAQVIQEGLDALRTGQPRTRSYTLNSLEAGDPGICGGTARIFIEPLAVPPVLLVIGGGHVGRALADLGKWAGYRVLLSDDRPQFCNPDYAPGLDAYIVCKPVEVVERVTIDNQTYVTAVTRGLPVDMDLLPDLLKTEAAYIGLIGSRRRWELTMKTLKEERGLTDEQLARIHAPIGLELQAETPREIALSIMAEVVMVRRGGSGRPMKHPGQRAEET